MIKRDDFDWLVVLIVFLVLVYGCLWVLNVDLTKIAR